MNIKISSLNKTFQKHGVISAYFFGSQKDSGMKYLLGQNLEIEDGADLDIALLLQNVPLHIYKFYGNVYYDLSNLFEPFNVDIVFLHEVNSLFKFEIIKGHRIYASDEELADEYEENVLRFASDLNYKRKMFEKDFYEALEDGYFEIELE